MESEPKHNTHKRGRHHKAEDTRRDQTDIKTQVKHIREGQRTWHRWTYLQNKTGNNKTTNSEHSRSCSCSRSSLKHHDFLSCLHNFPMTEWTFLSNAGVTGGSSVWMVGVHSHTGDRSLNLFCSLVRATKALRSRIEKNVFSSWESHEMSTEKESFQCNVHEKSVCKCCHFFRNCCNGVENSKSIYSDKEETVFV